MPPLTGARDKGIAVWKFHKARSGGTDSPFQESSACRAVAIRLHHG